MRVSDAIGIAREEGGVRDLQETMIAVFFLRGRDVRVRLGVVVVYFFFCSARCGSADLARVRAANCNTSGCRIRRCFCFAECTTHT